MITAVDAAPKNAGRRAIGRAAQRRRRCAAGTKNHNRHRVVRVADWAWQISSSVHPPPEVGTVLPLEQARVAHDMLAGAPHKRGKIVLRIGF
jgi:hypothetical protein